MVALITRESVEELRLQPGMKITAVVNATDVVILTDEGGIA
jgi:molybdopterin-binding protein